MMGLQSAGRVMLSVTLSLCTVGVQQLGAQTAGTPATNGAGQQEDMKQAKLLHNQGMSEIAQGSLAEARSDLEKSLRISMRLDPNGEQCASTHSTLGNVLRAQGDLASAEMHLRASLDIRRKIGPDTLALASSLNNLGNLYRVKGDFVQAQKEYEESYNLAHRLAPQSEQEAGALMNLGVLAQSRDDLPLAANYYERSAAEWAKVEPHSVHWAQTTVVLGQVRQDQGNLKEAERLYQEVIAANELLKTSPVTMAGVDRALGQLYTAQNRTDEAIEVTKKGLALTLRLMPGSLAEADVAEHLGELTRSKGDWAAAEKYYRESFEINERLVPDTSDVAENLHGLGMVEWHAGKNEEAVSLLTRAVDALEAQSSRLGGSELVNANFRASYSQFYRDLADLLIYLKKTREAFAVTERYRARAFLDQLVQRKLTLSGVPKELMAQLRANAEQYETVQGKIKRLSQPKDQSQLDQLKAQLVDLSASRADAIASIRRQSPGFAALRFPSTLSAAETQASLDPGTVLISFLVEPQTTYAFVLGSLGGGTPMTTYTIPQGELALRPKVQALRTAIQGSGRENRVLLRQQSKELYDLLLKPAEDSMSSSERILILPDGPLYELPFAALLRDDHYLAEWKPVSTTLSATLFAQLKQQRRQPDSYQVSLAAFGAAVYTSSQATNQDDSSLRSLQRSAGGGELAPLRFSKPEAEQIARLFPGRSQLYEGQSATEENAKKLGSEVRYIHFAVHGLLDEEHPLDSALAFTTPTRAHPGRDNGYLQAWELYQDAHWDADMVVLSACQSALGREFAGDGLIGLTRAVHYAGARSVLSSLWNIDDEKTAQFMTTLYAGLRDGLPKDQAVQAAQLKLIHSRGGEAPYYWAAFTLQGDWK